MTRGEMRSNIRYALGMREPDEQAMIDQAIYQGVLDVLRRTSCFISCVDADVPDDSSRIEFAAAGPVMKALHVMRGGQRMMRVSYAMLLGGASPAFTQIGQILIFSAVFAPGEQLQLYAVVRPPEMTADTDAFEDEQWGGIPEEFQDAVELNACARLASRADDGTSQMGGSYWVQYVGPDGRSGRVSDIRRQMNLATGHTLGPAQLLTDRRGLAYSSSRNGNGNGGNGSVGYILPTNDLYARVREKVAEQTA